MTTVNYDYHLSLGQSINTYPHVNTDQNQASFHPLNVRNHFRAPYYHNHYYHHSDNLDHYSDNHNHGQKYLHVHFGTNRNQIRNSQNRPRNLSRCHFLLWFLMYFVVAVKLKYIPYKNCPLIAYQQS